MKVKIIEQPEQLNTCTPFYIRCLLWGTREIPETRVRIGFLPGTGFLLQMTCREANPLRRFTKNNSPVYTDSAMEAFFCFSPKGTSQDIYLNFEMNANGALLAMYGTDRLNRTAFTDRQIADCRCRAVISQEEWDVFLTVPLSVLREVYGEISLENGSTFSCNFYKLAEEPSIEHYASYAPVISGVPNFHLPEYFERSVIVTEVE